MASESKLKPVSDQASARPGKKEEVPATMSKYPSIAKMAGIPMEDIVESHDGREATLLKYIYSHPKLDTELRGSPAAILAVMDEFAATEDFLINIGPDKAKILTDMIHEQQPKVLVELGTYVGCVCFLAPPFFSL